MNFVSFETELLAWPFHKKMLKAFVWVMISECQAKDRQIKPSSWLNLSITDLLSVLICYLYRRGGKHVKSTF
jgi:hypothetical protein